MHWIVFSWASLAAAVAGVGADKQAWKAADAQVAACFEAADHDPRLALVNGKYPRRDPSAAQLADASVATEQEADQLRVRIDLVARCRGMRIEAVGRFYPSLLPSYGILYFQADQLYEYLTQKWITYGEANRLSQLSQARFKERESAYFSAATEPERQALADKWSNAFSRARVDQPPERPPATCDWVETALLCH